MGFLLKCSASQSPNSRSFDSVFSAQTALNPLSTVLSFLSSTFSNGAHAWLNPHIPFKGLAGGNRIAVGLLASRLLLSLYISSREKYLAQAFMNIDYTKIAVGKYLVSPLAKQQGEGRYAASVSIRSGRGSGTHDRVLRFSGIFDSAAAAVHYATEHALGWIHERSCPACA